MKVNGRIFRLVVFVLIMVALVIEPAGSFVFASAPKQTQPAEGLISNQDAPQPLRSPKAWTEADFAAAKPMPLLSPGELPKSTAILSPDAFKDLTPGVMPGSLPDGKPLDSVLSVSDIFSFNAPTGYTYPAPFTRYTPIVKSYAKEYPYKAIGKLFFVQRGVSYVCSAAVIGTNAIWTAGHCVHDGTNDPYGWSYDMVFVPGYPEKKLGRYDVSRMWATTRWYSSGDMSEDFAGVVLYPYKRKSVATKTGYLGFAWNWPVQQHWFSMGYPAAAPFNGAQQVVCASSYAYSDTSFAPAPMGVGCDQTGGTSGGPWILAYGTGYYVNGNQSYRYTIHPLEMYSPYFGDAAYSLYSTVLAQVP